MRDRIIRGKFSEVVRIEGTGAKAYVEFGDPNASPRPRREIQNFAHRAMTAGRGSLIQEGQVINWAGARYMLAGQHTLSRTRKFLAVEVGGTAVWTRDGETLDPVTRMPRDNPKPETLDPAIPVVIEPLSDIEEEDFSRPRYRVLTTSLVEVGDRVDGKKVLEMNRLLGLRVLVVS